MTNFIPKTKNNVNPNSIIGWRRLQRSADSNYKDRVAALKTALGLVTPAAAASAAPAPSAPAAPTRRFKLGALPNERSRDATWGWTINKAFNKAYAKNATNQSNLYIKKANDTYRKVTNRATGNFNNTNVYNWDPTIPNFAKQ